MKQPTYKEQFDKLTAAYINGEVDPWTGCGCFVGNLLNKSTAWPYGRSIVDYLPYSVELGKSVKNAFQSIWEQSGGLYTPLEIYTMEKVFMRPLQALKKSRKKTGEHEEISLVKKNPEYENVLFYAFSQALDLLREIHLSKGEIIEETPLFIKRTLTHAEANV